MKSKRMKILTVMHATDFHFRLTLLKDGRIQYQLNNCRLLHEITSEDLYELRSVH